tara:strand:- start:78056 stop:78595 length:540 start_codon:yes stop_codon:yes gene_type:complete
MKSLIKATMVSALLLLAGAAAAQPPLTDTDQAQIRKEVLAAISDYYRLFAEEDMDAMPREVFFLPVQIMHPGGIEVHSTDAAMINRSREHLEQLKATGWAYSEYHDPRICVLNRSTAIASGRVIRKAEDGTPVPEGATTYVYTRTDNGWRIASFTGHGRNEIPPCQEGEPDVTFSPKKL